MLLLLFASCATKREGAQQLVTRRNVVERVVRDSVFVRDSVSLVHRADTVFVERLRTLYRDRVRVDTFLLCDTLFSERVVTVEKAAPRFSSLRWVVALLFVVLLVARGVPQRLWQFLKRV